MADLSQVYQQTLLFSERGKLATPGGVFYKKLDYSRNVLGLIPSNGIRSIVYL